MKGTLIEGVQDYNKINTNLEGDVIEIKEFKSYVPKVKSISPSGSKKKEIFACETGVKENLNRHITEPLEKIMKVYDSYKEKGRR